MMYHILAQSYNFVSFYDIYKYIINTCFKLNNNLLNLSLKILNSSRFSNTEGVCFYFRHYLNENYNQIDLIWIDLAFSICLKLFLLTNDNQLF